MEMTSATSPRSSVIGVIGTVKVFFLTSDFHHLDIAASPCYIKHKKKNFCHLLVLRENYHFHILSLHSHTTNHFLTTDRQHYKINTRSLNNKHEDIQQQTIFYKYADGLARSVFLFPKYIPEPRAEDRGQANLNCTVNNIVVHSLLLPSNEDQIFNKGHVVTSRRKSCCL